MEKNKTTKPKSNVRIVQLASLETAYPIVQEGRAGHVTYGMDNDYPDYLLNLFLESPTNNAIITAVANMITGDGLEVDNSETNPTANTMVQTMFNPKALKKISFNLKLYGYAPIIVKGGAVVTSVNVSDGNKWRSGRKDENDKVEVWYYSDDWSNTHSKKGKIKPYSIFSYNNMDAEQVFIFTLPFIGLDYYPPVDYNGGTTYIQLEAEIGEFHLSAIQNGLYPATMINFNNGVPPDDEQDEIEKKVGNKFGASANAGRFFLSFNDSAETATTIDTLDISKIDKQYEFLSKETTAKIMVAHRVVSPIIFGVRDGSGLGNNAEELQNSYLLYYETVIRPYQEIILDGVQTVLYKNEVEFDSTWVEYMPFKRDKVVDEAQKRTPSLFETRLALSEHSRAGVKPPDDFKIVKQQVYDGSVPAKSNGVMVLFKIEQSNPDKRNSLLSQLIKADNYYPYEFVKENPNTKDMYWVECTLTKGTK